MHIIIDAMVPIIIDAMVPLTDFIDILGPDQSPSSYGVFLMDNLLPEISVKVVHLALTSSNILSIQTRIAQLSSVGHEGLIVLVFHKQLLIFFFSSYFLLY